MTYRVEYFNGLEWLTYGRANSRLPRRLADAELAQLRREHPTYRFRVQENEE